MFYRMFGILMLTTAAFGAAFRAYIGTRKPDLRKPGISSYMTASGMILVGAGLLAWGHPVWKALVLVGAWDYAVGAGIAAYRMRRRS